MIVIHSHCQMANQMFMYACAYSLSKKKKTNYCLSDISNLRYFKLLNDEPIRNKLKYLYFRVTNFITHKYPFLHFQDNFTDYTNLLNKCSKNSWLYGYFQGEKYFSEHKSDIEELFEIKDKYSKEYYTWMKNLNLNNKIVAVHIRRKDYKDFNIKELMGPDLSLPLMYYHKNLLPYINNSNYSIVFLSDDIDDVKNEFSFISNAIFSENSAIVDLQILINSDILILANSSFSWWGAWLNKNKNKQIFVPKYFLGFKIKREYPVNIIPNNWIKVDVYE